MSESDPSRSDAKQPENLATADPLTIIKTILDTSVVDEGPIALSHNMKVKTALDKLKQGWIGLAEWQQQMISKQQGTLHDFQRIDSRRCETAILSEGWLGHESGWQPSARFVERVLHGFGVLPEGETFAEFRDTMIASGRAHKVDMFPDGPDDTEWLKSKIPGVQISVSLGNGRDEYGRQMSPYIDVKFSPAAIVRSIGRPIK